MTQNEFNTLPALVPRKLFLEVSGLNEEDLMTMVRAWEASADKRKTDLSPENVRRLLDAGQMPVWHPPPRAYGDYTPEVARRSYRKVALAVICGLKM